MATLYGIKNAPLLPNVQRLAVTFHLTDPTVAAECASFIVPVTLTDVTVFTSMYCARPDVAGGMQTLAARFPAVEQAELTVEQATTGLVAAPKAFSDRKSTRLNSSHSGETRMPSSA